MIGSVQVEDWEAAEITLTSPLEAEFDAAVQSLFRGNVKQLLKLKPFLVIISNNAEKAIVAYTLRWKIRDTQGTQIIHSQHKYPDAVAGTIPRRGNEIRPGEQKIVPMSIELNCGRFTGEPTEDYYLQQFANWFEEHADTVELCIGLDGVIFEDGELIGTDKSDLGEHYTAYVQAKQDLYRSLLNGVHVGQSLDEMLRTIDASRLAAAEDPGFDFGNPLTIYSQQATDEVRSWRREYGDVALVDILKQALRRDPFLIRKRSPQRSC